MTPQQKLKKIREEIDKFNKASNAEEDPDPIYLIQDIEDILSK